MPQTGIEPVRCRHHGILSPARLPVPPLRQTTRAGLEPATSAVTGRRSNQLSHRAKSVPSQLHTDIVTSLKLKVKPSTY